MKSASINGDYAVGPPASQPVRQLVQWSPHLVHYKCGQIQDINQPIQICQFSASDGPSHGGSSFCWKFLLNFRRTVFFSLD